MKEKKVFFEASAGMNGSFLENLCKLSFPDSSDGKESACNTGDLGSIPGLGRCPGESNGYPLQNSYLGNHMDRGAWKAVVNGIAKSQTQLSD